MGQPGNRLADGGEPFGFQLGLFQGFDLTQILNRKGHAEVLVADGKRRSDQTYRDLFAIQRPNLRFRQVDMLGRIGSFCQKSSGQHGGQLLRGDNLLRRHFEQLAGRRIKDRHFAFFVDGKDAVHGG